MRDAAHHIRIAVGVHVVEIVAAAAGGRILLLHDPAVLYRLRHGARFLVEDTGENLIGLPVEHTNEGNPLLLAVAEAHHVSLQTYRALARPGRSLFLLLHIYQDIIAGTLAVDRHALAAAFPCRAVHFAHHFFGDGPRQIDSHADGMVHPFLDGALHAHLGNPVDVPCGSLVVRRLGHQLIQLLEVHGADGLLAVAGHGSPLEELVVEHEILLEAVAHLVAERHFHILVVGVDLLAALVVGPEDRLDAGSGLSHEGGGAGRGYGEHRYVAAADGHHLLVQGRVGVLDAQDHGVLLLPLRIIDREGAALLRHLHRRTVGLDGQSLLHLHCEIYGLVAAVAQAQRSQHVTLGGDAESGAPAAQRFLADLPPQVVLSPLDIVILGVLLDLGHYGFNLLHLQIEQVIHQTHRLAHVRLEKVEVEICLRGERLDDV